MISVYNYAKRRNNYAENRILYVAENDPSHKQIDVQSDNIVR